VHKAVRVLRASHHQVCNGILARIVGIKAHDNDMILIGLDHPLLAI
jgi:hypothetical protein